MKKLLVYTILLTLCSISSLAQSTGSVEMADTLRRDGKIYTVVTALVIILTVMIVVLIRVDRKLFKLEKEINKQG